MVSSVLKFVPSFKKILQLIVFSHRIRKVEQEIFKIRTEWWTTNFASCFSSNSNMFTME